jgi:hypothetical protein
VLIVGALINPIGPAPERAVRAERDAGRDRSRGGQIADQKRKLSPQYDRCRRDPADRWRRCSRQQAASHFSTPRPSAHGVSYTKPTPKGRAGRRCSEGGMRVVTRLRPSVIGHRPMSYDCTAVFQSQQIFGLATPRHARSGGACGTAGFFIVRALLLAWVQ